MPDYECAHCGMPMKSRGTYFEGDRFCKDCVNEGKYAAQLIAERNKLLARVAEIEKQIEDMGYSEYMTQQSKGS